MSDKYDRALNREIAKNSVGIIGGCLLAIAAFVGLCFGAAWLACALLKFIGAQFGVKW